MNTEGERLQHPKKGAQDEAVQICEVLLQCKVSYKYVDFVCLGTASNIWSSCYRRSITLVWQNTIENEFQSYITYFVAFQHFRTSRTTFCVVVGCLNFITTYPLMCPIIGTIDNTQQLTMFCI